MNINCKQQFEDTDFLVPLVADLKASDTSETEDKKF